MAWSTVIANLESAKTSLASTASTGTTESANCTAQELNDVRLKADAIICAAQDLKMAAEAKLEPTQQQVLEGVLDQIRADKERTEKITTDAQGFITSILFESEKVAQKIEQLWLYSDETINRRGKGTTLKEVAK